MGRRNQEAQNGSARNTGETKPEKGTSRSSRLIGSALKDPEGMNRYQSALLEDIYECRLTDQQIRHALQITGQTLTLARLQLYAKSQGIGEGKRSRGVLGLHSGK